METFEKDGISVIADAVDDILFTDESDKKFYEVAKFCNAPLVTRNLEHCPQEDFVKSVANYYHELFGR